MSYYDMRGEKITTTVYSDADVEESYDEFLDKTYGKVEIAGVLYHTSFALKKTDPIGYWAGVDIHYGMFEEAYDENGTHEGYFDPDDAN